VDTSAQVDEKLALLLRTRDAVLASVTAVLLDRIAIDIREWTKRSLPKH
jgi:hypothetical protein